MMCQRVDGIKHVVDVRELSLQIVIIFRGDWKKVKNTG